jgi:hypothetical protein
VPRKRCPPPPSPRQPSAFHVVRDAARLECERPASGSQGFSGFSAKKIRWLGTAKPQPEVSQAGSPRVVLNPTLALGLWFGDTGKDSNMDRGNRKKQPSCLTTPALTLPSPACTLPVGPLATRRFFPPRASCGWLAARMGRTSSKLAEPLSAKRGIGLSSKLRPWACPAYTGGLYEEAFPALTRGPAVGRDRAPRGPPQIRGEGCGAWSRQLIVPSIPNSVGNPVQTQ